MFYDSKGSKCQVYEVRPLVCKLYPVTLMENYTSFAIKVDCEYGKDLYRNLVGCPKDKMRNPIFRAALTNALTKHVWR
jgi:Fe-S-cluster containining protein